MVGGGTLIAHLAAKRLIPGGSPDATAQPERLRIHGRSAAVFPFRKGGKERMVAGLSRTSPQASAAESLGAPALLAEHGESVFVATDHGQGSISDHALAEPRTSEPPLTQDTAPP
jgi:hypothetical protein